MITPRELKSLYKKGQNISEILRKEENVIGNNEKIIEISYDLQSGSYINAMKNPDIAKHKEEYSREISRVIKDCFSPETILEAGVGEATTLSGVLNNLSIDNLQSYGFDISWSRVALAKRWLKEHNIENATLCTGSLLNIPFSDNSIDIVYTSHSIEPNGGNEEPILKELYRITREFLILLEPGYELASDEAKLRMEKHGYCRNIKGISESLGYEVIEHKLFTYTANPLNPTALTIIKKNTREPKPNNILACPMYKSELIEIGNMLFSPEGLVVYPILDNIPCLRIENGIVASIFPEIINRTIAF